MGVVPTSHMPLPEPAPSWTFLSNHAHVLLCIARDSDVTIRALSDQVGITERAVQRILSELQQAGYVHKQRIGRRNYYVVDGDQPLRHPLEAHQNIGALIGLIASSKKPARRTSTSSSKRQT
jgi:DNA-binding transcriptional ArsR family regulator